MNNHQCVTVKAPARLHLGFLDLSGDTGRMFGSLGVSINRPSTKLSLKRDADLNVRGPEHERAQRYLLSLAASAALKPAYHLDIERTIPAHAGFGSGTQLALAVASAFCALEGLPFEARAAAEALGRGCRSGIGIGGFETGGVILDGGRGPAGTMPPIIGRLAFPPQWRILLMFDTSMTGRSGADETSAFRLLPPAPASLSAELCRLALLKAMPAVAERNFGAWGAAVGELQRRMGDYFAPFQNGRRFTSPRVAKVLAWLEGLGINGVGQTSWGPTGFAFFPSSDQAQAALNEAKALWADEEHLRFMICMGRNSGAKIETGQKTQRSRESV